MTTANSTPHSRDHVARSQDAPLENTLPTSSCTRRALRFAHEYVQIDPLLVAIKVAAKLLIASEIKTRRPSPFI